MNLSIKEAAVILQIKECTLRKYLACDQVLKARRSLSGHLFYLSKDLKKLSAQISVLKLKNQTYYSKRRRV